MQDNNIGVAGVSKATLYLLDRSDFVSSLDFAADNDIKIINASFAYTNNGEYAPAINSHKQAIENYGEKGGLLICSAGNKGVNTDITYHYPSGYGDSRFYPEIDNVISVGAINRDGTRCSFSNYGNNSVHIYAPGEYIINTYPASMCDDGTHTDNYANKHIARGYHAIQGTSMAAPFVTGTAALILSYNQSLTGAEIKNIILDNATNITINGSTAKLLNAGNALTDIYDPYRLGLRNMGWLDGSGWQIQVTNPRDTEIRVIYNTKMCYGGDGQNWTGLSDIAYFDLPARASRIVAVNGNATATHVAFSFIDGKKRYITYANELNEDTYWLNPKIANVDYHRYYVSFDKNGEIGMTVSIVGKNGNKWLVDLTNNTGKGRTFNYNSRMCYAGDAQNWLNLNDPKNKYLANGATTPEPLEITENMTATSIAISYTEGIQRFIFYAYDLNVSGTMSAFENTKPQIYDAYGMSVAITGKEGNTWKIYLRNDTGMRRTFEYNRKMCFAGDAETWNLSADVGTVTLEPGGNYTLSISENGTATSIAISYIDNNYRKIFYAYDLKKNEATMTKEQASFDINSPPDTCIAAGMLITLADGTQKAVEELTGDEMLLVWNMETGTFDSASIIFIDSDQIGHYEVIALEFSDGTTVDVISEHAFWDLDLNKYVYLDENAEEYIGDWFNKQTVNDDGSYGWTEVQLTDVEISTEVTEAYSPVTYGHLCYYVNGMLSMPGGITGFINIFDVDSETLTIDEEAKAADIEEYGLFTYEEFYEIFPVSEDVFDAFNGQYLKISVGKGLITYEQIGELIERYSEFF